MKKLFGIMALCAGIVCPAIAAFPTTPYVQISTGVVQAGGFSTQTGKVGALTLTGTSFFQGPVQWTTPGFINGQCLGLTATGLTTTYICGNSGGGGGSSALGVNQNGVAVTSPTIALNFLSPPFKVVAVGGGTTAQFTLDPSSVTLYGTNIPASAISAGVLGSGVIASSLAVNSVYPLAVAASTYTRITLPAGNVAAGALGPSVIASSVAIASVGVDQLNFSGTASSSTYARGDGTWAPSSGLGLGTITGVTAGFGLTGGGSTGTVRLDVAGVSLSSQTTGLLAIGNGGTGTSTPSLLQGSNVIITGAWPNQTINSTAGGGSSGPIPKINTASQYSIPFYSTTGTSNTLSGSANFSYNQTTVTLLGPFIATSVAVSSVIFNDGTILTSTAGAGSTVPGGSNTNVQFNNSGAFGGSSDFQWSGTSITAPAIGPGVGSLQNISGGIGLLSSRDIFVNAQSSHSLVMSQGSQLAFVTEAGNGRVVLNAPTSVAFTPISFTLPNSSGTSGQFMRTDGNGILSWATASGGGGSATLPLPSGATNYWNYPSTATFVDTQGGIFSTMTVTSLTAGQVVYPTTGGLLTGSPSFTWNSTTEMMNVMAGSPASLSIASGSYDTSMNKAGFVRIAKNYAFVSGSSSGTITIFDISVATSPIRLSQIQVGTSSGTEGIDVQWPYLYSVNLTENNFTIYNISNPRKPTVVGVLTDGSNLAGAEDVHVFGNYAYIVDFAGGGPAPSVTIVDVTNPAIPVIASSITISGASGPVQLLIDYPYAYLTGSACNVYAINIQNPLAPTLASTYAVPGCTTRVVGADYYGRFLYLAGYTNNAVYVADISSPTAIVAVSTVTTGTHTPWALHTYGNKLFMTSINDNSILQYSLVNASTPTIINSLADSTYLNTPDDLWMVGTQLYVTTHGTLFQGCGFTIVNVGGLQVTTMQAGAAKIDNLDVGHEIHTGLLYVQDGMQSSAAGFGNLSMNTIRGAGLNTCGDSSHGVSFSSSTGQFGCQSITGTASSPGGSSNNIQYNNGGNFGGLSYLNNGANNTLTDTGYGGISISSGSPASSSTHPLSITWASAGASPYTFMPIHFNGSTGGSADEIGMEMHMEGSGSSNPITASSTTIDCEGGASSGSGFCTAAYFSAKGGSAFNNAIYVNQGNVNIQGLSASSNICTDGSKNLTTSGCSTGGGSGASTLGVSTGNAAGYTGPITSSPTLLVNFDSTTFKVSLQGGATAFVMSLSTITATSLGALTGNQTITLTGDVTGSGATSIATTAAATQTNIRTFTGPITITGISLTVTGINGLVTTYGIQGSTLSLVNASSPNTLTISSSATGVALVSVSSAVAVIPQDFLLTVSSAAGTTIFGVQNGGHVISSGTYIPVLTSCGVTPSVTGTDYAFTITGGTGSTGCTATFGYAFQNVPVCQVSQQTMSLVNAITYTYTASAITISQVGLGTNKLDVVCIGNKG